ncbi:MAG: error-prone DNA polymerase, partial [Chloroflexota bacterium]
QEHLTAMIASQLEDLEVTPSNQLHSLPDGEQVRIGGLLVAAQRPPTANGVAFLAIEDVYGMTNVVLMPPIYQASRKALRSSFIMVEGDLQLTNGAVHVLAHRVSALYCDLPALQRHTSRIMWK